MVAPRNKERIFANTREMLEMTRLGLADATGPDPHQRRPGLMNLFTYGRSVTMAIQTMKHTDPSFDDWWRPYQKFMAGDPLMKFFNKARTEVLHEGELASGSYMVVGARGPVDLSKVARELNQHAPPNTINTFFGDRLGGSGWKVRLPDGSTEHVYFQLPADADIESGLQLHDPPDEHEGKPLTDTSIATLGQVYLATLTRIVDEFIARFRTQ